jgi:FlaA1/EpsC-like NDP-sugar epimerase
VTNYLTRFISPVLTLPRIAKVFLVIAVDISSCVLATWLAFYLRLGEFVSLVNEPLWAVLVSLVLVIPIFIATGLYRAIFRYSGLPAIASLTRAVAVYGLLFAALFTAIGVPGVPRTVGLIQPLLLLFFVGASRMFARIWLGGIEQRGTIQGLKHQVLIYGAGDAGRQLSAALENSNEMRVVGFLDDNRRMQRQVLNGLPIYNPDNLERIIYKRQVTDVLLALPSVSRQRRNEILKSLASHKLSVRTLPGLSDLAAGRVSLGDLRDLDIDDLLGRDPVKPNNVLINQNTHKKTVLVTGAGGSIGSELCRQILKTQPRQLLLLENSEFALYRIHQELQASLLMHELEDPPIEIIPLLASVCDEIRIQHIMNTWCPETVYHAAAYKHVPLVEHNPAEGVRNNVWGTKVCAEAAVLSGVKNFVLISTDKAVRPTNIMGASKRLAEMVLQAMYAHKRKEQINTNESSTEATIFSMVRFGNVLGSSGSVVPLFREQIKNGGPITLTHQDITRYFMTIPEAAQLVIQAGAMGVGGDVFVLDMGQPVRIYDLASRMIELSGLTLRDVTSPDGDIEISITGLRPGEKLYEELLIGENAIPTEHPRIMKAHEEFLNWDELKDNLGLLGDAITINDTLTMRAVLQKLVQGYQPSGDVVDWVYLALESEPVTELS